MKTLAFVFCYERPAVLADCLRSLFEASAFVPDKVVIIDDGSRDPAVLATIYGAAEKYQNRAEIAVWAKPQNLGFSDSAVRALAHARDINPDFLFFIESDYVFSGRGLDVVWDTLTKTDAGRMAAGVVGYDHPNFYSAHARDVSLPDAMRRQMGEDNVNRAALYRPTIQTGRFRFAVELVSNTCWSCYLNWRRIQEIAAEFPELDTFLDLACAPEPNPAYAETAGFVAERVVDDGMLSHGIALAWNRWAIKHGVDRERFGAWVNIKPTVAEHRWAGGMHT